MMRKVDAEVAVLFVMEDSYYKSLPGCDCFDESRDARTYKGTLPVIAHPPCRTWGKLAHMATRAAPGEKDLGLFAVAAVRRCGGVVEHPVGSKLFDACGCGSSDHPDAFGGEVISVDQWDWFHAARKPTLLYIVGTRSLPEFPPRREERPERAVGTGHGIRIGSPKFRSRITDRERIETPLAFALWLVDLAKRCGEVKT